VDRALKLAVERFKILAGAIICHGILGAPASIAGYGPGNVLTSYDQIKYVGKVNFLGVYNVAQKVADILIKQKPLAADDERGVIIMVTSIAGLDGSILAYGTSKGSCDESGSDGL
jgi:NAD(P)-dependent dehydrogenase (short-subunit alcohol dehydrogenase family)